jgi:hypothetical protein
MAAEAYFEMTGIDSAASLSLLEIGSQAAMSTRLISREVLLIFASSCSPAQHQRQHQFQVSSTVDCLVCPVAAQT